MLKITNKSHLFCLLFMVFPALLLAQQNKQDTLCISGISIFDSTGIMYELNLLFEEEVYEGEMDPGTLVRRRYNDSIEIYSDLVDDRWITKAFVIQSGGFHLELGVHSFHIGEYIGELIAEFKPELIASGTYYFSDFNIENDIDKVPSVLLIFSDIESFGEVKLSISFSEGFISYIALEVISD